jgi:malate synthase
MPSVQEMQHAVIIREMFSRIETGIGENGPLRVCTRLESASVDIYRWVNISKESL